MQKVIFLTLFNDFAAKTGAMAVAQNVWLHSFCLKKIHFRTQIMTSGRPKVLSGLNMSLWATTGPQIPTFWKKSTLRPRYRTL